MPFCRAWAPWWLAFAFLADRIPVSRDMSATVVCGQWQFIGGTHGSIILSCLGTVLLCRSLVPGRSGGWHSQLYLAEPTLGGVGEEQLKQTAKCCQLELTSQPVCAVVRAFAGTSLPRPSGSNMCMAPRCPDPADQTCAWCVCICLFFAW